MISMMVDSSSLCSESQHQKNLYIGFYVQIKTSDYLLSMVHLARTIAIPCLCVVLYGEAVLVWCAKSRGVDSLNTSSFVEGAGTDGLAARAPDRHSHPAAPHNYFCARKYEEVQ